MRTNIEVLANGLPANVRITGVDFAGDTFKMGVTIPTNTQHGHDVNILVKVSVDVVYDDSPPFLSYNVNINAALMIDGEFVSSFDTFSKWYSMRVGLERVIQSCVEKFESDADMYANGALR